MSKDILQKESNDMSIKILDKYLQECYMKDIEPTWEGLRAYKKDLARSGNL